MNRALDTFTALSQEMRLCVFRALVQAGIVAALFSAAEELGEDAGCLV